MATETVTLEQARSAKPSVEALFAKIAKVVGIGITRIGKNYGVKVNLAQKIPENVTVPESVDGVPIKTEVVGTIRKQES
jgi:hypothetical protein